MLSPLSGIVWIESRVALESCSLATPGRSCQKYFACLSPDDALLFWSGVRSTSHFSTPRWQLYFRLLAVLRCRLRLAKCFVSLHPAHPST
jgi:hypothetical protein